jgi:predicted nucleic acid-binding protein
VIPRLFIDSSVLFAAACSAKGHSRDLMILGQAGKITVVISNVVILEVHRNLIELYPEQLPVLEKILIAAVPEIFDATPAQVRDLVKYIVAKDAPILAAAKAAKVDMLVSLDRKHILGRPELGKYIGAEILSPKDAYERVLAFLEK